MPDLNLVNELQQAASNSKTGKMLVLGKLDGVTKGINIDIRDGKIMRINMGDKTGRLAANTLTDIRIEKVSFIESESIIPSPEENTPDIASLLGMIAVPDKSADNDQLVEAIIQALSKVLGPSSKELVLGIAAEFPPGDKEHLFIRKCKHAVIDIVGSNQAEKLFESLRKS